MKYKPVERVNPQNRDVTKWYAQIVLDGEASMDDIVAEIEKFSALSEPDIRGVIIALENVVQKHLSSGRMVRFDRLGTLYPSISSRGEESAEAVTSNSIRGYKINFRPGTRISKAIRDIPKKKV